MKEEKELEAEGVCPCGSGKSVEDCCGSDKCQKCGESNCDCREK